MLLLLPGRFWAFATGPFLGLLLPGRFFSLIEIPSSSSSFSARFFPVFIELSSSFYCVFSSKFHRGLPWCFTEFSLILHRVLLSFPSTFHRVCTLSSSKFISISNLLSDSYRALADFMTSSCSSFNRVLFVVFAICFLISTVPLENCLAYLPGDKADSCNLKKASSQCLAKFFLPSFFPFSELSIAALDFEAHFPWVAWFI